MTNIVDTSVWIRASKTPCKYLTINCLLCQSSFQHLWNANMPFNNRSLYTDKTAYIVAQYITAAEWENLTWNPHLRHTRMSCASAASPSCMFLSLRQSQHTDHRLPVTAFFTELRSTALLTCWHVNPGWQQNIHIYCNSTQALVNPQSESEWTSCMIDPCLLNTLDASLWFF